MRVVKGIKVNSATTKQLPRTTRTICHLLVKIHKQGLAQQLYNVSAMPVQVYDVEGIQDRRA
jgi:hypothetical protein